MKVAVIGAGTMGQGIAVVMVAAGHEVIVVDSEDRIARSLAAIGARLHGYDPAASGAPIGGTADLNRAVAGAAVVFEAVPEDLDLKLDVLAAVSASAEQSAILATNTSSLPLDRLAEAVALPERFLAAHFFHPAETIPGVEVARTASTAQVTVERMVNLLRLAGKEPIEVGACVGFVANRLQLALFLEALACVEEGIVSVQELDAVVRRTMGVRLPAFGPFAVADMAGLDVYHAILTVLREQYGERFTVPPRLTSLVTAGRLGVKSGAGFLEYDQQERRDLPLRRDTLYRRLLEAIA